jgi:hypothetical protein
MHLWDINKYPVDGWWTQMYGFTLTNVCTIIPFHFTWLRTTIFKVGHTPGKYLKLTQHWHPNRQSLFACFNFDFWHPNKAKLVRGVFNIFVLWGLMLSFGPQVWSIFKHLGFVVTQTPFRICWCKERSGQNYLISLELSVRIARGCKDVNHYYCRKIRGEKIDNATKIELGLLRVAEPWTDGLTPINRLNFVTES